MTYQPQAEQIIHILAERQSIDSSELNDSLVDVFSRILGRQIEKMEGDDIDIGPAFHTLLSVFTWVSASAEARQKLGSSP